MQNDLNVPAPGRFCRLQIMAFLLLNLLGSCVHVAPAQAPAQAASTVQTNPQIPAPPVNKMFIVAPARP